jgi:hypothetical protein
MAISPAVISRLKSQLLTSGLQQKDQPLFQVINQLIGALSDTAQVAASGGSGGGTIGPPGPAGKDGPFIIGSDGQDGHDGINGQPGPQGFRGATGPQGSPGLPVRFPTDGIDGIDGFGYPGPRGAIGASGSQGHIGFQGPPGLDGRDGQDSYWQIINNTIGSAFSSVLFSITPFTRAQAITLNTVPLTLVPAQGASVIIAPLQCFLVSNYTTAFGAAATLQIRYNGSSSNLISVGTPWNSSANKKFLTAGSVASLNFSDNTEINSAVQLLATGGITGGAVNDKFAAILLYILINTV